MMPKWNLTGELDKYINADIVILSIGKSGRTWLRVLINKYLSLYYDIPFGLGNLNSINSKIPSIVYSHEAWLHFSEANWVQRVLGKYVIPDKVLSKKKIILHVRDPRDIVVSLYFHKTKRAKKKVQYTMTEFIRHRKFGIKNIIFVMNLWHRRLKEHPAYLLTRYEDFRRDPLSELIRLLEFIELQQVDRQKAIEAVKFADFENMKNMEAQGRFGSSILSPADILDPNSFKVREGKVGGYLKHFGEADLRYLDNAMKELNNFFMYEKSSR